MDPADKEKVKSGLGFLSMTQLAIYTNSIIATQVYVWSAALQVASVSTTQSTSGPSYNLSQLEALKQ